MVLKKYSLADFSAVRDRPTNVVNTCTQVHIAACGTQRPTKYFLFKVESKRLHGTHNFVAQLLGKKKDTSKANAIQSFNWNMEFFLTTSCPQYLSRVSNSHLLTLTSKENLNKRYSQRKETLMP